MKTKYRRWNNFIKSGTDFYLISWQKNHSLTEYIKYHQRARAIHKQTRETFHKIIKFGVEE